MVCMTRGADNPTERETSEHARQRGWRLPLRMLLLAVGVWLMAAEAPPAHAGYYSNPSYSGGSFVVGSGSQAYMQNSGGSYSNQYYGMEPCSTSGTITATFTWNAFYAGEKPPKAVIVQEYCDTYAQARAGGPSPMSANASADNGLGHPVAESNTNSTDLVGRIRGSKGTRYKVLYPTGDGTIVLECSPAVSATAISSGPMKQTMMRVSYRAELYPVGINLVGSTPHNGLTKVLAGQQITAQISGLSQSPLTVNDPGPGGFVWTVGGNVFKNYTYNSVPCVVEPVTGVERRVTSGISFFTKKEETLKVTFSGDLIVPSGALPQPTLHLEVQSENLLSLKPTAVWGINPPGENTGLFPNPFNDFAGEFGALVYFYPMTITVPSPFSGGSGALAQIVESDRTLERQPLNGKPATFIGKLATHPQGPNGPVTWVSKPKGLDGEFPYKYGFNYGPEGQRYKVENGYEWQPGIAGGSGDSPKQPLSTFVNDGGGNDWRASYAADTFSTYMMYRPPAVGTQLTTWVPLQVLNWNWKTGAVKVDGVWTQVTQGPYAPVFNVPSSAQIMHDHPTWDYIVDEFVFKP